MELGCKLHDFSSKLYAQSSARLRHFSVYLTRPYVSKLRAATTDRAPQSGDLEVLASLSEAPSH